MRNDTNPIEAFYKTQVGRLRRALSLARIARPVDRKWGGSLPVRTAWRLHAGGLKYSYRGIPMLKNPLDVALYQELVFALKPRTIIEIGSYLGASALWFADMLQTYEIEGRVISVDIKPPTLPAGRNDITFLHGDANNLGDVLTPSLMDSLPRPLLVIEDSVHTREVSLNVLRFFDHHLARGEYIIVEDGNVTDLGVAHQYGGGPGAAIADFLREAGSRYEIDADYCDRYGHNATANPNGYLRRVV